VASTYIARRKSTKLVRRRVAATSHAVAVTAARPAMKETVPRAGILADAGDAHAPA
jgi:hypothetical protein